VDSAYQEAAVIGYVRANPARHDLGSCESYRFRTTLAKENLAGRQVSTGTYE
jgi:hypothetical protein